MYKLLQFLLTALLIPQLAYAESQGGGHILYSDANIVLTLQEQYSARDCEDSPHGKKCMELIAPFDARIIVEHNKGYALSNEIALLKHMSDSAEAIKDIPRIRLSQSRILQNAPLIGLIEVLRDDEAAKSLLPIGSTGQVVQSAILIPLQDELYQVFVYSEEAEGTQRVGLVQNIAQSVVLHAPLSEISAPSTAMSLRIAVIAGASLALIVVVFIQVNTYLRRRKRRREEEDEILAQSVEFEEMN
ncbi:MAG: hypothetical protein WC966_12230 [Bradymonadales bacterium]|jgi:hypothetical protein